MLPTSFAAVAEVIVVDAVGNAAAGGNGADQVAAAAAAVAGYWPQWRGASSVALWECPSCCP